MQYNFKKHYYDPYDSLDVAWKARISHDWLSIGEAACLSGYSRQYINRLVTNRRIIAKRDNEGKLEISWQNFVKWFTNDAAVNKKHDPIIYTREIGKK